jgi:predicted metal-binding protein
MIEKRKLENIFKKHGLSDFKWLTAENIEVGQWVRMKCQFGCDDYGLAACCPPNMPSFAECLKFFREYDHVAVFHFEKKMKEDEVRKDWNKEVSDVLLAIERDVFLSGYYKAFMLFMSSCPYCPECTPQKDDCTHPEKCRPTPEGLCMDVYATVRKIGYPIEVVKDHKDTMNRYAFLLVE